MAKAIKPQQSWRNRIVGYGEEAPEQLLANPLNFRIHPRAQQQALGGVLSEVGWVDTVLVNRTTGHVVDGHLRVELAISRGEPTVPVTYVDLTEAEEKLILATFDPLSAMAVADKEVLATLLSDVSSGEAAVQELLASVAEQAGIIPSIDFPDLPDGDRAGFQQMTFTVSDAQAWIIKDAVAKAKDEGGFGDTGNENSNGNALARIAEAYLG